MASFIKKEPTLCGEVVVCGRDAPSDTEDGESFSGQDEEHNVENFMLSSFAHFACSPMLQAFLDEEEQCLRRKLADWIPCRRTEHVGPVPKGVCAVKAPTMTPFRSCFYNQRGPWRGPAKLRNLRGADASADRGPVNECL